MSEEWVTTKAVLLSHIERDWQALITLLDRLTIQQLTDVKNADGWTVKDHIAHLAAWEHSAVCFLQRKPRHTALGVPEDVYLRGDIDEINHVIFQLHHDEPYSMALQRLKTIHEQMMTLLKTLNDEDFQKPYVHYLPNEYGEGDGPPAMNIIYGNTAHHYRTHQAWIEAMLEGDTQA